jgi:hypothetical protein
MVIAAAWSRSSWSGARSALNGDCANIPAPMRRLKGKLGKAKKSSDAAVKTLRQAHGPT